MVGELESPRGEGQAYFFFGAFFFLGAFFFGAFLTACTGAMWGREAGREVVRREEIKVNQHGKQHRGARAHIADDC